MNATNLSLTLALDPNLPFLQPPPGDIPPGPPNGPPKGLPPLPTTEMEAYLDKDFFDIFEIIMNVGVINILSIAGSVGNVLCIYILSLQGFDNSTNITLVSLAVADLLILVTLPLRKLSLIVEPFDKALSITVESYIVSYNFLTFNRIWSLISNAHVALIAVERFLAVYFPFQVSRWVTTPRITAVVCIIHVIFYIMLIPVFTMFKIGWVFDPTLNETIAIPFITDFYLSREEQFNIYNSYVVNLFLGALFLLITLVCCIGICTKLVTLSKKRRHMTIPTVTSNAQMTGMTSKTSTTNASESRVEASDVLESQKSLQVTYQEEEREEHISYLRPSAKIKQSTTSAESKGRQIDMKVVRLLLIVCFVYLVLIFPSFLLLVFQEIYHELREPYWRRVNFLATSVSMFLIALNSSLNFIIYIVNSQKFYATFKQIIRRKKKN